MSQLLRKLRENWSAFQIQMLPQDSSRKEVEASLTACVVDASALQDLDTLFSDVRWCSLKDLGIVKGVAVEWV